MKDGVDMRDQSRRRCYLVNARRRFNSFIGVGVLMILLIGTACSNGGSEVDVSASGSGLKYDSQAGVVDGYVVVEMQDLVTDSKNIVQQAILMNFSITMGDCPVTSYSISDPGGELVETVEMTSNGAIQFTVSAEMMGRCVSSSLFLNFMAEVTTQANGSETVSSRKHISLEYPVYGENGALVSDSGSEQDPSKPGAVSFVYKNSRYDAPYYIDAYAVHVVSSDGNGGSSFDAENLHIGVMAGVKQDSDGVACFGNNGSITVDSEGNVYFSATGRNFESVEAGDLLIILPNASQTNSRYLGGWEVIGLCEPEDHEGADEHVKRLFKLPVKWAGQWDEIVRFDPGSVFGLVWAIGTRERHNPCENSVATADIALLNSSAVINGTMSFELRYDPFLAGKDIFAYCNIDTLSGRVGVGVRKTLPGTGLVQWENTWEASDEDIENFSIKFSLKDSDKPAQEIKCVGLIKHEGGSPCEFVSIGPSGCDGNVDVGTDKIKRKDGKSLTFRTMETFLPEYPNFPSHEK